MNKKAAGSYLTGGFFIGGGLLSFDVKKKLSPGCC